MRFEFWINRTKILFGLPFILLLLFTETITTSIFYFLFDYRFLWPSLLLCVFLLIVSILWPFLDKSVLTKIVFSNDGIECRRLKKQTAFIHWEEITEIGGKPSGMTIGYLQINSKDYELKIELSKKMYNVIMQVCPIVQIRERISSMEEFRFYRKNK